MPALRPLIAVCALVVSSIPLSAQTPPKVSAAIREAKAFLADGHPHNAVESLERQLQFANGDQEFNATLRAAYTAELKESLDPVAQDRVKAKLSLLGEAPAEAAPTGPLPAPTFDTAPVPAPAKPAANDWLKQATSAFNRAKSAEPSQFLNARDLFNLAFRNKVEMTSDQTAAWAYCRLKVAADKLNKSTDGASAAEVVGEVEAALRQVPNHAALRDAGRDVLTLAKKRAGNRAIPNAEADTEVTGSFRVKGAVDAAYGEKLIKAAEAHRSAIFARWSGPPGGAWSPACDLVIHADAAAFESATKLSAGATGRADVKLQEGVAVSRRIDLRADDATLFEDALPRELTTVILADLFPNQAPPKWVELGMAALATSDAELGRYLRTVSRCDRAGELPTLDSLMKASDVPAKGVTGFHVASVSLADFLVRWQGEKTFTAFVRDSQRYGTESAVKRQYGAKDFRELEGAWRANVLDARK